MSSQSSAVNVTGTGAVNAGACTYRGFWITATGANTAVTIYDNASAASGTVLASFTLASVGQSAADDITDGLRCVNGIYLQASAAVVGHVRIG
jgi:hypothetical protein